MSGLFLCNEQNCEDASPTSSNGGYTSVEDEGSVSDDYDQLEHFHLMLDGGIQQFGTVSTEVESHAASTLCSTLCDWLTTEYEGKRGKGDDHCISRIIEQLSMSHHKKRISHVAFEFDYCDFGKSGRNSLFPASPVEIFPNVVATMGFYRRFNKSTDFAFCAGLRSTSPMTLKVMSNYTVVVTLCVFGKRSKHTCTHAYTFNVFNPKEIDWLCINEHMFRSDGYISSHDDKVRILVTYVYDVKAR